MSDVHDHLYLSENFATAASEALTRMQGIEATVKAALAQRDAIHAQTLATDRLATVIERALGVKS